MELKLCLRVKTPYIYSKWNKSIFKKQYICSLVIGFITHKHQSSFVMSLTIFPSLTSIFSGGGHHSSPHPTISPNQQIPSQNKTLTRDGDNENRIALMYNALWHVPAVEFNAL
ncbi:hypothetical protein Hanom_Chr09g00849221 [Helianthus anomalus]